MTPNGLPTSIDAERLVLGSIMIDGAIFQSLLGIIEGPDFSLETHRRIFRRINDLHERGEKIDRITVFSELSRYQEAESCGGLGYLSSLDNGLPQLPNIDAYARIVREKSVLRSAIYAAQQLINRCMMAEDNSQDVLAAAEATITALARNGQKQGRWRNPGEVMSEYPGGINAFLEPHRNANGLPTPWPALTNSICGLHEGELLLIGGRPSMGKSIVMMQMGLCAAQAGHGVAVFSLEMTAESLIYRLLSGIGRVDAQRFRAGYLDAEDRRRLATAVGVLQDLPLKIDDTRARTVPTITAALRKLTSEMDVKLVLVDHLQLMRGINRSENRHQELSEITHALKHLAGDMKLTVGLCSQLNRKCEEENRRPQLSDLKETGSLEEDADVVTLVHRWERYQKWRDREEMRGVAELILAKQRNGPTGVVRLVFLAGLQKFENAHDGEELHQGE